MKSGATFDSTGAYRYALWRVWDAAKPRVTFILLNPSTADATHDDPTIRRCIGFGRAWGYGRLDVVNLFAYRATHPNVLKMATDPIGPENNAHIAQAAVENDSVVAAWGNHGQWLERGQQVLRMLNRTIYCLGITQQGQPRHPLYVRKDNPLQLFQPQ